MKNLNINLLISKSTLSLILSILFLTILLVIIFLVINEEFVRYKKRIDKGIYNKELRKELKTKKKRIKDDRTPVFSFKNARGLNITMDASNPTDLKDHDKEVEINEYLLKKNKSKARKGFRMFVDISLSVLLAGFLAFVIVTRVKNNLIEINGKTYVTVETGSMATKHENNKYLDELHLDNQIKTFSLITLDKVEDPNSLGLYDIAAYKDENNRLIVHRIIKITDKNGETYFTFRGDANESSDYYLVKASDVLYKYNGESKVALGRFICYIKSTIGAIVISYVIITILFLDITENRKEKYFNKKVVEYKDQLNEEEVKNLGTTKLVKMD